MSYTASTMPIATLNANQVGGYLRPERTATPANSNASHSGGIRVKGYSTGIAPCTDAASVCGLQKLKNGCVEAPALPSTPAHGWDAVEWSPEARQQVDCGRDDGCYNPPCSAPRDCRPDAESFAASQIQVEGFQYMQAMQQMQTMHQMQQMEQMQRRQEMQTMMGLMQSFMTGPLGNLMEMMSGPSCPPCGGPFAGFGL